jgi:hypothetical protein
MLHRLFRAAAAVALLAFPSAAQESKAYFDSPLVVADQDHRIQSLLDLDGDGLADALGSWWETSSTASLQSWFNDGAGALVPAWEVALGTVSPFGTGPSVWIAPLSINGDALDDFVVGAGTSIRWYVSNGLFPPTLLHTVPTTGSVAAVAAADFDGDGDDDVAVLTGGATLSLQIHLSQGTSPPVPSPSLSVPYGIVQLLVAEVSGDGAPDLVACTAVFGGSSLHLFPVAGGVPQAGPVYSMPSVNDPMPAAGDVDGDGDEDLVVFRFTEYQVLRRTGASTFSVEPWTPGGPATNLVDLDGDGDLDGVCCGGGGGGGGGNPPPPPPKNTSNAYFRVSLNDGTGAFAPAFLIQGVGATHIAGVSDLDADGDPDLVAGRCVYYSPDAGGPTEYPTIASGITSGRKGIDAEGDGDIDFEFGLGTAFVGRGDGTFDAVPLLAPPAPPGTQFAGPGFSGDFDGDGDLDLVVRKQAGSTFLQMWLLRNNGGGVLEDGGPAGAPGANFTVVPGSPISNGIYTWQTGFSDSFSLPADVDGDGDRDLVLRRFVQPLATLIWVNDGTGFFLGPLSLLGENVKAVADMNGDGLPDLLGTLVGTSAFNGPLVVRHGAPGALFGAPSAPIVPDLHSGDLVDVFDIDGDGDLDIGTAHGNRVVYLNDGFGGFAATLQLATGPDLPNFGTFLAVDFDGDGLKDVVAGRTSFGAASGVDLYRRTGPGLSFAPPVVQTVPAYSLADVDGDGDPDSVSYWIVKNRRFEGASAGLRRQYGMGLAGSGATAPTIGATGPFRVGFSAETRVTGGLGGAPAVLLVGTAPLDIPLFGGSLLVSPITAIAFTLGGPAGVAGAGKATFPWFVGPALAGGTLYKQVGVLDLQAPQSIAISNGLRITVGL